MGFLENLNELMKEKNLNRTELAKEIGIAPSTINSWYNRSCDNISLQTLLKLSNYFEITMEELVHGHYHSIVFSTKDYSLTELQAIKNFSNYIKSIKEELQKGTI